jgi:hypothetical protein
MCLLPGRNLRPGSQYGVFLTYPRSRAKAPAGIEIIREPRNIPCNRRSMLKVQFHLLQGFNQGNTLRLQHPRYAKEFA